MFRRTVSGIILILLSTSMLATVFNIQPAMASGTIHIRADGSIDPPTAPVSTVDNVTYAFIDDIYDEVVVERSNMLIDGAGYTLRGDGSGSGFSLSVANNVTVKSVSIEGFYYGVYLNSSSHVVLFGNNITANSGDGIRVDYLSSDNIITGNSVRNNSGGGIMIGSSYNVVSQNNITENGYVGVTLDFCSHNTLSGNDLKGNRRNFYVGGDNLDHYIHSIDDSNLVDGKPVYYLIGQTDRVISSSTHPHVGWLALINCSRIDVTGLSFSNNGKGLLLAYTNNSRIERNSVTNNEYGIYLDCSSNCSISENYIADSYAGIWLRCSSYANVSANNIISNNYGINFYEALDCTISGNNVINNGFGVNLEDSSDSTVSANNIANSGYGIFIYVSLKNMIRGNNMTANNRGIQLAYSSGNNIFGNNIRNSEYGIDIYDLSNYNRIYENNITNSYTGIRARAVYDSSFPLNNSFLQNSFIDNTIQADTEDSVSIWDDGYPSGGNYWSDYNGIDANQDGIGDTPYVIDANNTDHYPLMIPYIIPEFPSLLILPLFALAALLVIMVYRRKTEIGDVMQYD